MFDVLKHVTVVFPSPSIGIDSDNGSEFIKNELLRFRGEEQITCTRPRSENKNDRAPSEQKNWSRVRELVGYQWYDVLTSLIYQISFDLPDQFWKLERIFTNCSLPQQKLLHKTRQWGKCHQGH